MRHVGAWQTLMRDLPAPPVTEVTDYLEGRGNFVDSIVSLEADPQAWWGCHSDSALSKFARLMCKIPATTADVERLFSAASFAIEGRERLGLEEVQREVYIRWNMTATGMTK